MHCEHTLDFEIIHLITLSRSSSKTGLVIPVMLVMHDLSYFRELPLLLGSRIFALPQCLEKVLSFQGNVCNKIYQTSEKTISAVAYVMFGYGIDFFNVFFQLVTNKSFLFIYLVL